MAMTPKNRPSPFARNLWLSMGMFVVLAIAFAAYAWSEKQIDRANDLRHESFVLADELRQSSDDLTKMARLSVETGNPIYRKYFQDMLDIRGGSKPRPDGYQSVYWDFMLAVGKPPRPGIGQATPLLELMRQAGFTAQELDKLAEAKANSDRLAVTEFEAMRLAETAGPQAEANRAKARMLLFGDKYHQAKLTVMKPIDECYRMMDQRTRNAVLASETNATILRIIFIACGLSLVLLLWRTYGALRAIMGGPVEAVLMHLARIGSGNFSSAITVADGTENSIRGWLAETQAELRKFDRERMQAEQSLKRLNAELEQRVAQRTEQLEVANRELRETLELNEKIISTSAVGISAYHAKGPCVFANDALAHLIGCSRKQLLAQNFWEIASWQQSGLLDMVRLVLLDGATRAQTFHMVTTFGKEVWFDCYMAMFTSGGEPHLLNIFIDTSQRELAREGMLRAKEEAERASAAKSDFLSRMSHELRTPLNAILGFSELLSSDTQHPLTADQTEQMREIQQAGERLLQLVNDILDLSDIDSGDLVLASEPVPVAPLVQECLVQMRPLADAAQIKLAAGPAGDCVVRADRLRLRQVLLNLLSNAIKYNRIGGSVLVDCGPAADGRLRISVRDSGRGIAADFLPRLFRPFERVASAYEGSEGSGIGLALSKHLIEAMQGSIGAESVLGTGSTFWVDLPGAQAASISPEPHAGHADATPAAKPTARTLLYVEDNPSNLLLVQKVIAARTKLTLIAARTAEDGLALAAEKRPDLILLDINLPGMDGLEALRRLQDNPATRDIPVIAVSANAMPKEVQQGLAAGFADYLTKPLDIPHLLSVVEALLA